MFFCEYSKIFNNSFFYRTLSVAAFEIHRKLAVPDSSVILLIDFVLALYFFKFTEGVLFEGVLFETLLRKELLAAYRIFFPRFYTNIVFLFFILISTRCLFKCCN